MAQANGNALNRGIFEQAAQWYVQLQSCDVTDADRVGCERWRAGDPRHEQAWQRLLMLVGSLRGMPPSLSRPSLARSSRRDRRAAIKLLTLLAIAAPVGYAGWRQQGFGADLRTATGEQRTLQLSDGSTLQLNTATSVDLDISAGLRRLQLRQGEIRMRAVAAAAGPASAFVVAAPQARVSTEGGTLLLRDDGERLRIGVEQGCCVVDAAGLATGVQAGSGVWVEDGIVSAALPIDAHASDWTRGVLYADDLRLAEFAAELSRYRNGLLRCDPVVGDLRISGAFQLRDTDSALASLSGVLPVAVVYRSRWWATIVPSAAII